MLLFGGVSVSKVIDKAMKKRQNLPVKSV